MSALAHEISMYADNVRTNAGVVSKRADNASKNTEDTPKQANGVSNIRYILSYSINSAKNCKGNPSDNTTCSGHTAGNLRVNTDY